MALPEDLNTGVTSASGEDTGGAAASQSCAYIVSDTQEFIAAVNEIVDPPMPGLPLGYVICLLPGQTYRFPDPRFHYPYSGSAPGITYLSAITENITVRSLQTSGTKPIVSFQQNLASNYLFQVNATGGLTLDNVVVSGNGTGGTARGIFVNGGNLTITNSVIRDFNNAQSGGAVVIEYGSATIQNSEFTNNQSILGGSPGGAIRVSGYKSLFTPTLTLTNTRFTSNSAPTGGAVYLLAVNRAEITGNTFSGNRAYGWQDDIAHIDYAGGAIAIVGGTTTISDSIFTANTVDTTALGQFPGSALGNYVNTSSVTIHNSCLYSNAGIGVHNNVAMTLNAQQNWWGALDGPAVGGGSGGGEPRNVVQPGQDSISGNIDYDNWLTMPPNFCPQQTASTPTQSPTPNVCMLSINQNSTIYTFSEAFSGAWNFRQYIIGVYGPAIDPSLNYSTDLFFAFENMPNPVSTFQQGSVLSIQVDQYYEGNGITRNDNIVHAVITRTDNQVYNVWFYAGYGVGAISGSCSTVVNVTPTPSPTVSMPTLTPTVTPTAAPNSIITLPDYGVYISIDWANLPTYLGQNQHQLQNHLINETLIGLEDVALALSYKFPRAASGLPSDPQARYRAFRTVMGTSSGNWIGILFYQTGNAKNLFCQTNIAQSPNSTSLGPTPIPNNFPYMNVTPQATIVCDIDLGSDYSRYTIVHELGHNLEDTSGGISNPNSLHQLIRNPLWPPTGPQTAGILFDNNSQIVYGFGPEETSPGSGNFIPGWTRGRRGWGSSAPLKPRGNACDFQQDTYNNPPPQIDNFEVSEAAADMFLNWVYELLQRRAGYAAPTGFADVDWLSATSCITPTPLTVIDTTRPGIARWDWMEHILSNIGTSRSL